MNLVEIGRRRVPDTVGGKAAGLRWLSTHGYDIPRTWAIPWDAFDRVAPSSAEPELKRALEHVVRDDRSYAVRSSANVEDAAEHSFAGQFTSIIDVRGTDAVCSAVLEVRRRGTAQNVGPYLDRAGLDANAVKMAVVVQEMVEPVISGVAFSANPTTALDEVIVEAVRGNGEALVQEGVTPQRWVRKWGAWREHPRASDIPTYVVMHVADSVAEMGRRNGWPVDVEWVWDGERVVFVQMREISSIDGVTYYSNRIAREVLPGVIHPLVWSVNVPLVNGAWIKLLDQVVGPTGLEPDDLARLFYYRAYFNMGALGRVFDLLGLPRESLEVLTLGDDTDAPDKPRVRMTARTISKVPRVLAFAAARLRLDRQVDAELAELASRLERFENGPAHEDLTGSQIIERVDELMPLLQDAAYLDIVVPLAAQLSTRLFARRLDAIELELEDVDFGGRDEGGVGYDPRASIQALVAAWEKLPPGTRSAVAGGRVSRVRATKSGTAFLREVDGFLDTYGHFSDSGNDFSVAPWREQLPAVLRMIAASGQPSRTATRADRSRLADLGASRSLMRSYDRAARWQVLRERVSSFYTKAYGRLRPLYLRLGDILARREWIDHRDDVFVLYEDELASALAFELSAADVRALVAERREEMDALRDAVVPELIFGDEEAPLVAPDGDDLRGTPTSRGYHVGRAVRVTSVDEIERVHDGDVLVVPFSDVGWTPLFSRAGAVVAESGGFLSHSSIIAREYGIPAVVSVGGAMSLIPDGATVTVDGFSGTVTVEQPEPDPSSEAEADEAPAIEAAS